MASESSTGNLPADAAWRKFPQLEAIFEPDQFQPFLAKVEGTCRQLQEMVKSGSKAEAERAETGLRAYARALQLLNEIRDIREKAAAE